MQEGFVSRQLVFLAFLGQITSPASEWLSYPAAGDTRSSILSQHALSRSLSGSPSTNNHGLFLPRHLENAFRRDSAPLPRAEVERPLALWKLPLAQLAEYGSKLSAVVSQMSQRHGNANAPGCAA